MILLSMQGGFVTAGVFVLGLYIRRRYEVEDHVRGCRERIENLVASGDHAAARREAEALAHYLDHVTISGRPTTGWATKTAKLAVTGAIASSLVALDVWLWFALLERNGWPSSLDVHRMDIAAVAAVLLLAWTIVLPANAIFVLRGRDRVIAEQAQAAALAASSDHGAPQSPGLRHALILVVLAWVVGRSSRRRARTGQRTSNVQNWA